MPKANGKLWVFLPIVLAIALGTWTLFGLGWMVIVLIVIGITFPFYCYDRVPAYHAQATEDVEGNLGVWLPGLNFFNPLRFVKKTGPPVDLQADVHLSVVDSYQSRSDGVVFVKYVMSIRIDIFGDDPTEAILKFLSFEPGSIQTLGRSITSQLISDWFATNDNVFTKKKTEITEEVFGGHGQHSPEIEEFMENHGVHFHVNIEDVDPDDQVKKAKAAAAQATGAATAMAILMAPPPRGAGMTQAAAEKYYRIATQEGKVTEVIYTVDLTADGLENLENFSVLGGVGGAKKNK